MSMRLTDYLSMFPASGGVPVTRPTGGGQVTAQRTSDLGLMMVACSAAGLFDPVSAIRTQLLASVVGGRIAGYVGVSDSRPAPVSSGLYALYSHLWALLGMSTGPLGVPAALITDLLALTAAHSLIVFDREVEWGAFKFGDGTQYGVDLSTAYVMRESAIAGLILNNEALRTGSATLLDASWRIMLAIVATFRSGENPRTFATAVSRQQASTHPDAEAYALAGILALRFGMHDVVDALLGELERCAVAQVMDRGLATGYAHVNAAAVSIRSTALAGAFYYAAMEIGMGRGTVRGVGPYRVMSGPLARLLMDLEGVDMAATLALDVCAVPTFLGTPNLQGGMLGLLNDAPSAPVHLALT
jgi:hypothetical protein